MTTPSSGPTPAAFADVERQAAKRLVERELSRFIAPMRMGDPYDAPAFYQALQLLVAEASASHIRSERVLVAIKQAWDVAPSAITGEHRLNEGLRLDTLITAMLQAYYGERS